jgi:CBS domain-containing protein
MDRRCLLGDDHVHAALVVDSGVLVAVVDRADLRPDLDADASAARAGRLLGRVIAPDVPLQRAHRLMLATGRRRLAVVDDDGALLGLLCLKHHGHGFCSDADVCARPTDGTVLSGG